MTVINFVIFGLVLRYSNVGFDLSDEAFYFINIKQPLDYFKTTGYTSHFGLFYHIFFLIVNENIQLLRILNVFITIFLGAICSYEIQRHVLPSNVLKLHKIILNTSLAVPTILITSIDGHWISTPSYNSLNLQGMLLTLYFLIKLLNKKLNSLNNSLEYLGISIGIGLTFLAKPSTALVLNLFVSFILGLKLRIPLVKKFGIISLIFVCPIVLAFLFLSIAYGSVVNVLSSINLGFESYSLLSNENRINVLVIAFRMIPTMGILFTILLGSILGILINLFILKNEKMINDNILKIWSIYLTLMFILSFLFADNALFLFGIVLGFFVSEAVIRKKISVELWIFSIVLFVTPFIFALGSSNHYWIAMQGSLFLTSLSFLSLIQSNRTRLEPIFYFRRVSYFAIIMQIVFTFHLFSSIQQPYRQPAGFNNSTSDLTLGDTNSQVQVSEEFVSVFLKFKKEVYNRGYRMNQPIIDLTGRFPGISIMLGGKNLGAAWFLSGYSGSDDLFQRILGRVDCTDLSNAWILSYANNNGGISNINLSVFGADLEKDYKEVATLNPRKYLSSLSSEPIQIHQPWSRKQLYEKCMAHRG